MTKWVRECIPVIGHGVLMFLSDSETERLLEHENNGKVESAPRVEIKIIGQGQDDRVNRTPGPIREKLSLEEKVNIGLLASVLGVKTTAEMVDKSPGMVGRIKNGKNGVNHPDQELRAELELRKEGIQSKALEKADMFLEMLGIGQELSDNLKAASVAEKVVNIYEKLAPKKDFLIDNRTQVIFYAPKVKESSEYPLLEVETQNG